jgi:virginiamycin B lyase
VLDTLRIPFAVAAAIVLAGPYTTEAQRGGQVQLPEGVGKDVVQARCISCHGLNQITGAAGYDQAGWKYVIESMIALPAGEMTAATQYLAAHFPEKPGRRPTLVAGPVSVTFKEWMVPTLGQRSRDPLQMADGTIWWTGQYASLVGRLNPKTGEMKEFELPPEVRPHSIAVIGRRRVDADRDDAWSYAWDPFISVRDQGQRQAASRRIRGRDGDSVQRHRRLL